MPIVGVIHCRDGSTTDMRGPMCFAFFFSSAGSMVFLCLLVLGMGCERSAQIGRHGGAAAAGTTGSGGMLVAGSPAGSGGMIVGESATASGGLGGCGVGCSGGERIVLSDPYLDCGDGRRNPNETCDDGNRVPDDGCDRFCRVEAHWICPAWGQPCVPACGNGDVDPDETCDDGNRHSDDGCSADCQTIESGWQCRVPGKACSPVCGDGVLLWNETCDDGNTKGGDGCSRACQVETGYVCPAPGQACEPAPCRGGGVDGSVPCDAGSSISICGDGIVSGDEECDDGTALGILTTTTAPTAAAPPCACSAPIAATAWSTVRRSATTGLAICQPMAAPAARSRARRRASAATESSRLSGTRCAIPLTARAACPTA